MKEYLPMFLVIGIFIFLIYLIFGKRISYCFSGDILMQSKKLTFIVLFINSIPSLFISVLIVNFLSEIVPQVDDFFKKIEYSYQLTVIFFFLIFFGIIGMVIEYYFYNTNEKYRNWKNEKKIKSR
jgi:hypothetical protein